MSDAPVLPKARPVRTLVIGASLIAAALGGALAMRWWSSPPTASSAAERNRRPIVQIVRQQTGFPDQSELVDRTCPSIATLVPTGSDPTSGTKTASPSAIRISSDGWLLTSIAGLPGGEIDAIFGDGARAKVSEVRSDPLSGLAIAKVDDGGGDPVSVSDLPTARAGQFAIAVSTPMGQGCSANFAMVASDFLADGVARQGTIRLQDDAVILPPGRPLLAQDGRILGIVADGNDAALALPASVIGPIIDELLRNSLSASTTFGFRVIDFAGPLAARLGDVRSGAGVSLVDPASAAGKAGLKAGDIITTVDKTPVSSASELGRALDTEAKRVTLTVQRRGDTLKIVAAKV